MALVLEYLLSHDVCLPFSQGPAMRFLLPARTKHLALNRDTTMALGLELLSLGKLSPIQGPDMLLLFPALTQLPTKHLALNQDN